MILLKDRYKECGLAKTVEKAKCSALFTEKTQQRRDERAVETEGSHSAKVYIPEMCPPP